MNTARQEVARLIWESEGTWQYDDTLHPTTDQGDGTGGLPIAYTTLVHGRQDYTVPPTSQRIESVIVKDSDGNWSKLRPFDVHDTEIALPEYYETAGLPLYYDLVGNSIMLYPKPSSACVTLTNGLQAYFSRNVTEIPVSATTTQPGFPAAFHRILSYACAIDFVQDPQARQNLVIQKDRLEKGLTRFYSKRAVEAPQKISPKKTWRQYI